MIKRWRAWRTRRRERREILKFLRENLPQTTLDSGDLINIGLAMILKTWQAAQAGQGYFFVLDAGIPGATRSAAGGQNAEGKISVH